MNTYKVTIFIEMDSVLEKIDDYNYESYNELFFTMLEDINRVKRKIIFLLKERKSKRVIKKYFHEDIFDNFGLFLMDDLNKIHIYLKDNEINPETSFAILSCPDTIEAFREAGIYTAYLRISENDLSEQKAFETVDYQKTVFTNLFDINYENLIFESQKLNSDEEDEIDEDVF